MVATLRREAQLSEQGSQSVSQPGVSFYGCTYLLVCFFFFFWFVRFFCLLHFIWVVVLWRSITYFSLIFALGCVWPLQKKNQKKGKKNRKKLYKKKTAENTIKNKKQRDLKQNNFCFIFCNS